MATDIQKLPDKLMSTEEMAQKKEELKHITNGDSKENIPPTQNGHSNGTSPKLQNGQHSPAPDMDTSEQETTDIKPPTTPKTSENRSSFRKFPQPNRDRDITISFISHKNISINHSSFKDR